MPRLLVQGPFFERQDEGGRTSRDQGKMEGGSCYGPSLEAAHFILRPHWLEASCMAKKGDWEMWSSYAPRMKRIALLTSQQFQLHGLPMVDQAL